MSVKSECLHDQFTPPSAVLANYPLLTVKVTFSHKEFLIGFKSDFIGYIWFGVCVLLLPLQYNSSSKWWSSNDTKASTVLEV